MTQMRARALLLGIVLAITVVAAAPAAAMERDPCNEEPGSSDTCPILCRDEHGALTVCAKPSG